MIFNTTWFLIFFLVFYLFLWLVPDAKMRFYYVLACSSIFHYHFAEPAGITPIIIMAVITFFIAIWMSSLPPGPQKKRALTIGLLVPVTGLIFYKYRVLLFSPLVPLANGPAKDWLTAHVVQVAMPLAISFFTFEFVHYLTDVYLGKGEAVRNPFKFAIFCIF